MNHAEVRERTPLHMLVSPQVANVCWERCKIKNLGDLRKYIEKHRLYKVKRIPWLFRFVDEPKCGIGSKSWKVLLECLERLDFDWRAHVVNGLAHSIRLEATVHKAEPGKLIANFAEINKEDE